MAPIERCREEAVADVVPVLAGVGGFPDAAAGGAEVELVLALRNAGDRGGASAAEGADVPEAQRLCGTRVDAAGGRLCVERREDRDAEESGAEGEATKRHGGVCWRGRGLLHFTLKAVAALAGPSASAAVRCSLRQFGDGLRGLRCHRVACALARSPFCRADYGHACSRPAPLVGGGYPSAS